MVGKDLGLPDRDHTHLLGSGSSSYRVSGNYRPSHILTAIIMKYSELDPANETTHEFLTHKSYEIIINVCYFKALTVGGNLP